MRNKIYAEEYFLNESHINGKLVYKKEVHKKFDGKKWVFLKNNEIRDGRKIASVKYKEPKLLEDKSSMNEINKN